MPADLSRNYRCVEGSQPVGFRVRLEDGRFAPARVVEHAKKRSPSKTDILAAGAMLATQVAVWHLWKYELGDGTEPKDGDVVDEAGVGRARWTVKLVEIHALTNRYRLTCIREVSAEV